MLYNFLDCLPLVAPMQTGREMEAEVLIGSDQDKNSKGHRGAEACPTLHKRDDRSGLSTGFLTSS